jgi:hypothetical protein
VDNGVGEIADGFLAADDGVVRAALGQELIRLQAAEPAAALGLSPSASADEIRARFLALVKLYHPNRFARRPADVVRLANEVFLHLRRAHQRMGDRGSATSERVAAATATAAGTAPPAAFARAADISPPTQPKLTRPADISPPTQPRLEVDAALARRRRARSQPTGATNGNPSAGSSPPSSPAALEVLDKVRRREEEQKERFESAVMDARQGRLPSARATLRALVHESPSARQYHAYLHYVTGRMHESAGRHSEAASEYDRALTFDPALEAAKRSRDALSSSSNPTTTTTTGGDPSRGGAGRFSRWFRK